MNEEHFTVYLAGPISGCNSIQRKRWREEIKSLLGCAYTFADPSEWEDTWEPSREMLSIDASDLVVANMWKESIGTTIGIMHARMDGKPVILIDPNHMGHKILAGLVRPELPVTTIGEAADRVRAIREALQPVNVRKSNGSLERFSREKLVRSIRAACVAAGVDDTVLPMQIIGRVNELLRLPSDALPITTGEIRRAVNKCLQGISTSPVYQEEVREAARGIQKAWEKRETSKNVDQLFNEAVEEQALAEARVRELERDVARLKGLVQVLSASKGKAAEPALSPAPPEPNSMAEAIRQSRDAFREELVILDSAAKSAENSPFLHPGKAFQALKMLAACAGERMRARQQGERIPGIREWFNSNREMLPGLEYKNGESQTTLSHWGTERTFNFNGCPILMDMHLAIGSGGPEAALRIHFAVDKETYRFLVGHVGRHLTNTHT